MKITQQVLQKLITDKDALEADLEMAHNLPVYQHTQGEEIEMILEKLVITELMIARYSQLIPNRDVEVQ